MMLRLLFFILLSSSSLLAQDDISEAKIILENFKNGMLLVRLQTADKQIEALESMNRVEQAEAVRQAQYEENKETILAFKQIFDFCPVWFFYAKNSETIRKGEIKGHIFDTDLKINHQTDTLPTFYLTGEFTETPNLGIDGFVLMDSLLFPLRAPFPFYQREHILLGLISLSKGQMIEKLNQKLYSTYQTWFSEP